MLMNEFDGYVERIWIFVEKIRIHIGKYDIKPNW